MSEIIQFPHFKLRFDNTNEYQFHSANNETFGEIVRTPAQRSLYKIVVEKYGLNINKAQTSSKFFNYFIERLEKEPEGKTLSPEDVSIMVRDGISRYCLSVNIDRESLLQ